MFFTLHNYECHGRCFSCFRKLQIVSPYKMSGAGENFPVSRGCKEDVTFKISAAGENLPVSRSWKDDFVFKMSAAGENFPVSGGCKGLFLPKFAVSRHFQILILQPGRKFPPCFRSEHNKGGIFSKGGNFLPEISWWQGVKIVFGSITTDST